MATVVEGSKRSSQDEKQSSLEDLEIGQQKQSSDPVVPNKAPDGGSQAWLVVTGGFFVFFCCLGFVNSFGTFVEYYLTHQLHDKSPDDVAWIGSVGIFLQFTTGLVGGPMFDRFGAVVIRPAAIGLVFAVMMLSLCKTYWEIMLVQGVLVGITTGFLQFPAFAAAAQYFDKKRAAAMGLIVSGSSVGGVVIPLVLSKMLNSTSLGFGWSVRIIGFLMIPLLAFACVTIKARLPSRATTFWIVSAYREPRFVVLICAAFFGMIGMMTPIFYMPDYAVMRGMSPTLAGYLVAILNAASTFGRIIPGFLADKFGRLNTFAIGAFATGIMAFCMNTATGNPGLIVYSAAFGFASGTIISGVSSAISICPKDVRDTGTYLGMGFATAGVGSLIGPPINGALVNHYGGFFEASMFSGVAAIVGGFVAFAAKLTTTEGIWGRV